MTSEPKLAEFFRLAREREAAVRDAPARAEWQGCGCAAHRGLAKLHPARALVENPTPQGEPK